MINSLPSIHFKIPYTRHYNSWLAYCKVRFGGSKIGQNCWRIVLKKRRLGGGGVINPKKLQTSFMDGPIELNANFYPALQWDCISLEGITNLATEWREIQQSFNFSNLKWLNFQMRLLKYGLHCKIEKLVSPCTLHIFFGIFCATKINVWLTNPSHICATNSEIKWTAQFYIQLVISQL